MCYTISVRVMGSIYTIDAGLLHYTEHMVLASYRNHNTYKIRYLSKNIIIIGHYNPFSKDYGLASHTKYEKKIFLR